MRKIRKNTTAILSLLNEMATLRPNDQEALHEEVITDNKNHHYFLLWVGFYTNGSFEDKIMVHFHVKKDGKVWVLANWTEEDVAEALIKKGVLQQDIVLGFHPQSVRVHTGYAVA
jgi:XisI protein